MNYNSSTTEPPTKKIERKEDKWGFSAFMGAKLPKLTREDEDVFAFSGKEMEDLPSLGLLAKKGR